MGLGFEGSFSLMPKSLAISNPTRERSEIAAIQSTAISDAISTVILKKLKEISTQLIF